MARERAMGWKEGVIREGRGIASRGVVATSGVVARGMQPINCRRGDRRGMVETVALRVVLFAATIDSRMRF